MQFEPTLWDQDEIQGILDNAKVILKKELLIMDYTAEGNSFRKQFACPLAELIDACQEYLLQVRVKQGDASRTVPFFAN